MNNLYVQIGIGGLVSYLLCRMLIPGLIRISHRLKLVDQPNERKVHTVPVPRFGGVAIFVSALAGTGLSWTDLGAIGSWPVLFSSLLLLFFVGVWDDLKNISPHVRFLIQIACAAGLAGTGVRLTSLYGILGVHALTIPAQYIVTILVIVGTTNAFNLIDGVDGLAGGLGFLSLLVLGILAGRLQLYALAVLLATFSGALLGFLRYNVSPASIFMGDGGSLTLGYLMSTSGILLIEKAHHTPALIHPSKVALLITAILLIPVFDTLRVFASRIRRGVSPFRADKNHIHHLFLVAGLSHRKTSLFLYCFQILLILLALALSGSTPVSIVLAVMVILFHLTTEVFRINQGMEQWLAVIKKMEVE